MKLILLLNTVFATELQYCKFQTCYTSHIEYNVCLKEQVSNIKCPYGWETFLEYNNKLSILNIGI